MKFTAARPLAAFVMTALLSGAASASGGGQYGQDNNSFKTKVDRQYEAGKSAYYARDTSGSAVDYCVLEDGKVNRVSRRSLKSWTGGSAEQLSASIVRCDNAEASLASVRSEDEARDIIYYLNKRYRLSLSQG